MKASVIMPSYLGEYEGCAKDRPEKFKRAVHSFLANDYPYSELVVVSDACKQTNDILISEFKEHLLSGKIVHVKIKRKKPLFSGKVRSAGIANARGEIIMYLDSDDLLGEKHISTVVNQMAVHELDWCYYNDWIKTEKGLVTKNVEIEKDSIGTSSIAHLNDANLNWHKCNGYGHDYKFVQKLERWSGNYMKIYGAMYIICHVPGMFDD